ncbi:FMN-binding protein [Amycolatopsis sp. NPDC049159]|uniref:FMN-binding protein n=1 Tax=Amycolatopsis sp. NPDC049159 TaxID=3157210 RepID=UPI0033C832B0
MRRIAIALAATVSIVVLLFSYRTSTDQTPVAAGRPLGGGQPSRTSAPVTSGPAASSPTTSGGASGGDGTFTGDAADTRYGPVQVRITVAGGRITDAQAIEYPQESGRDVRINSEAVPELNQEALQAQSAQIDTVSGATYTSEGYQQSLQSAIDAAHG